MPLALGTVFVRAVRGSGPRIINVIFQFFAGLKVRNFFWRDFDLRAGLGIASGATTSLAGTEAAKTANFDFVVGLQGSDDAFENRFNHRFGFLAGQFGDARDLFDEFRFRHGVFLDSVLSGSVCHGVRVSSYESL